MAYACVRRSSAGPCLGKPLSTGMGWELLDSKTSPLLGHVEDNTIELGEEADGNLFYFTRFTSLFIFLFF